MARGISDNQHYIDIAAAIREKNETETLYKPSEMAPAIRAIQGGMELNFEVVGGKTEPTNPKENTIWVETSTEITSWIFSFVEPTEPVEGMVWFTTAKNSTTTFNALKENVITVSPVSAKQYIDGTWETVSPVTYQNGKWSAWIVSIVRDGVAEVSINTTKMAYESGSSLNSNVPAMTPGEGYLLFQGSGRGSGIYYTSIDLEDKEEIVIIADGFTENDLGGRNFLGVWSSLGTYAITNVVARANLTTTGATITLNRSFTGNYVVGIALFAASSLKVKDFYVR